MIYPEKCKRCGSTDLERVPGNRFQLLSRFIRPVCTYICRSCDKRTNVSQQPARLPQFLFLVLIVSFVIVLGFRQFLFTPTPITDSSVSSHLYSTTPRSNQAVNSQAAPTDMAASTDILSTSVQTARFITPSGSNAPENTVIAVQPEAAVISTNEQLPTDSKQENVDSVMQDSENIIASDGETTITEQSQQEVAVAPTTHSENVDSSVVAITAIQTLSPPPERQTPIDPRLGTLEERLYTIQIASVEDHGVAVEMIGHLGRQLPAPFFHYRIGDTEKQWTRILYGLYESADKATSSIEQLPAFIRDSGPYVRSIASVQNAIKTYQ